VLDLIVPLDQVTLPNPTTASNTGSPATTIFIYRESQFLRAHGADGMTLKATSVFDTSNHTTITLSNTRSGLAPRGVVHYIYKVMLKDSTNMRYYLTGVDECIIPKTFKGQLEIAGVVVYVY
jgi:hypothetical protein